MIRNYVVCRDYETGSRNPYKTQVTQIAACIIDPRSMTIVEDSLYKVMVQPEWDDEKCREKGIDPVEEGALKKCGFTKDDFKDAIDPKIAWTDFCSYLKKYNKKGVKGDKWDAPIMAGYNSNNFDDIIDNTMCERYGPKPDDRGPIIRHPVDRFDVKPFIEFTFSHQVIGKNNSTSLDAVREYMGMDSDMAHKAEFDVLQTAHLLIKYLKLFRGLQEGLINLPLGSKVKFNDCFEKENAEIRKMLNG